MPNPYAGGHDATCRDSNIPSTVRFELGKPRGLGTSLPTLMLFLLFKNSSHMVPSPRREKLSLGIRRLRHRPDNAPAKGVTAPTSAGRHKPKLRGVEPMALPLSKGSIVPNSRHPTEDITGHCHMAYARERQVTGHQRLAGRCQLPQ
jgi:hypothetical protein